MQILTVLNTTVDEEDSETSSTEEVSFAIIRVTDPKSLFFVREVRYCFFFVDQHTSSAQKPYVRSSSRSTCVLLSAAST